jgi:hypothetical protein
MNTIGIKLPEPKRYTGDSKNLESWLYSVKLYFAAIGWDYENADSKKCCAYVSALLSDAAL